ncbi:related to Cytochrome P450 [Ustilago bromivora]|uniref:Related to Cytochrome P450 n=1 Tax=Ustilago bromivora TaxID=307758 RepID=A0A1K0G1C6_9BASI|nr:related to Cytochrome P450 [Ustilago bromivora]SYW86234.1 related to Cytochrome P450 [Ustilago bromivora]
MPAFPTFGAVSSTAKHIELRSDNVYVQRVVSTVNAVLDRTGLALPLLTLTFLFLVIKYHNRTIFAKPPRKELYYPPALPLIGHTLEVMKNTELILDWFLGMARSHPIGFSASILGTGTGQMHVIHRPEYIEYVQKTNFENFEKGIEFKKRFADLLGQNGIFNSDGHVWKAQRKMASHIFSVYQFRNWVQTVVHRELDSVIGIFDAISEGKSHANPGTLLLPDLFFRYTLSSFGKMAFGSDIHCLTPDPQCLHEEVEFSSAFDFVQVVIEKRFRMPFWQVVERFSSEGKKNTEMVKKINDFSMKIIDGRLRDRAAGIEREKKSSDGKDGKDLLDLFMDVTTDREDLISVVLNFIIAGRDTTAQGLSWLFYELMKQPQYVEEIRQEIRSVLHGTDGSVLKLNYDNAKDLVFTQACFNETLRLHPPVPKNGKRAIKDDVVVPQGPTAAGLPPIRVYANELLSWSDWVIARNPDVWGLDCCEFNPHRFIETSKAADSTETKSLKNFGQWKFHVFNGGPRLCLGMALANYEALSMIAAVIGRYDFGWGTKEQGQKADWPLKYMTSVTHPCQMYTATVVRREGS